jgi:hypothetical protein
MSLFTQRLLWCFAASLLQVATAAEQTSTPPAAPGPIQPQIQAPIQPLGQPYILAGEQQRRTVALRIAGTISAETAAGLLQGGGEVTPQIAAAPTWSVVSWTWDKPPAQVTLSLAGERWDMMLQARTQRERTRLLLIGAHNWPVASDIIALEKVIGEPFDAVVLDGWSALAQIGSGGWESNYPVMVIPRCDVADERNSDLIMAKAQTMSGGVFGHHQRGVQWGFLGLPYVHETQDAPSIIARDLSPWQIVLTDSTFWELGIMSPQLTRTTAHQGSLLSLCRHLEIPLIIPLSGGAGWWSESLVVERGAIIPARQGTRVWSATPRAVDYMAFMSPHIIGTLPGQGWCVLSADAQQLQVAWIDRAGKIDPQMHWRHETNTQPNATSTSQAVLVGVTDLLETYRQAFPTDPAGDVTKVRQARMAISRLSTEEIEKMHLSLADIAIILAEATVPENLALLRRLTGITDLAHGLLYENSASLPPEVMRDLLLRQLGSRGDFAPQPWTAYVTSTNDDIVLRALLRARHETNSNGCRSLLVERVRAQANGQLALERDPLLQHRLMTAVFDATDLSPTTLRPLAVAIRGKLSGFTGGPVERFIERHGVVRR